VVVRTGTWIAAVRARESARPDPLFVDEFAHGLAGAQGYATIARSEGAAGGENTMIPVRVRWFDDAILAAVAGGLRQVVLLGAGLDTRPYRLDLPSELDWYDLDIPEVLADKASALVSARPRCRYHPVGADLTGGWSAALKGAGFAASNATLWVAEGLFFYLSQASILDILQRTVGPGGRFLADIIGTPGLAGPAMRPYLDWCVRNGTPPPFGHDDPAALFAAGGWRVDSVRAPGAPDANYGRLPERLPGHQPGHTHFVSATAD
jgi:methyltransferase (TIGR00027 family)